MSDETKKSHWRSLAEQLGAKPADELDEQPQQPASDATGDGADATGQDAGQDSSADLGAADAPPAFSPIEPKARMPEKTEADWNSLAISLGIDPADLPPPASQPATPQPAAWLDEEKEVAAAGVVIEDASDELTAGEGDFDFGDAREEEEQESEPRGAAPDEASGRVVVEAEGGSEAARDEPGASDEDQAAVPRRRRRRRRRRGRGQAFEEADVEEENYSAAGSIESEVEFDASQDDERDETVADDDQEDDDQETDAAPSAPSETVAQTSDVEAGEADEGEQESEPRRRRRRRRGRRGSRRDGEASAQRSSPASESDDEAESDEEQHDESAETGGGERTVVHRNIPTWDEAMGIIIAKNMDGRSNDPRGSSGAGRRGGRGGRGGRGRGRSPDKRT